MTPLCELALKHGTDKYSKHHYTETYYKLFKKRAVKRLFEVGVAGGHSLRLWEEFFPEALIFGFDRFPRCMIEEGRIKTFLGDQTNFDELRSAASAACGSDYVLDIIIDDGAHTPELQTSTALKLLPFLSPNGIYVIEDVYADPDDIIRRLPRNYKYSHVRTGKLKDDVLIVIKP
jgi:hypothetical protein